VGLKSQNKLLLREAVDMYSKGLSLKCSDAQVRGWWVAGCSQLWVCAGSCAAAGFCVESLHNMVHIGPGNRAFIAAAAAAGQLGLQQQQAYSGCIMAEPMTPFKKLALCQCLALQSWLVSLTTSHTLALRLLVLSDSRLQALAKCVVQQGVLCLPALCGMLQVNLALYNNRAHVNSLLGEQSGSGSYEHPGSCAKRKLCRGVVQCWSSRHYGVSSSEAGRGSCEQVLDLQLCIR
jgi:hypothetical protein